MTLVLVYKYQQNKITHLGFSPCQIILSSIMFRNKMDDLKQSGLANLSNVYHFNQQRQRPVIQLRQSQLQYANQNNHRVAKQPSSCPNKFNMFKESVSRKKYFASNFHLNSQIKDTDIIKFGVEIPQFHDSLSTLDIQGATTNTILPLAQKNCLNIHKTNKKLGISNINTKQLNQQRLKTLGGNNISGNSQTRIGQKQQRKQQKYDYDYYRKFNVVTPKGYDKNNYDDEYKKQQNRMSNRTNSHRNLSLNDHTVQQKIDMHKPKLQNKGQSLIKPNINNQLSDIYPSNKKIKLKPIQYIKTEADQQQTGIYPPNHRKDALDYYLYQAQTYLQNPQFQQVNLLGKVNPTYLSSINGLSPINNAFWGTKSKSKSRLPTLQPSKNRLEQNRNLLYNEVYNSKTNFRKYLKCNKL